MGANVEQTLNGDLNAVIANAVSARVQSEMLAALSGDETIGKFVTAALQQRMEVTDSRSYRTEMVPFLTVVLRDTIQNAAKEACKRLVADELPAIEEEIRKALRRNIAGIATAMAKDLGDKAASAYGINVNLELRMPGE